MIRAIAFLAIVIALHGVAAFAPSALTALQGKSARLGRMSTQATPMRMAATAKPKERTVRAPTFNEVCSETGVTLSRYMMELARENPDLRDLESLVGGIQQVSN